MSAMPSCLGLDDLKKLSKTALSVNEVPLVTIIGNLRENPNYYVLERSKLYKANWVLCKSVGKSFVLGTHAFLVKESTNIVTGNFVPKGAVPPLGARIPTARAEASLGTQIGVTFDLSEDPKLTDYLRVLEDWVVSKDILPEDLPRGTWMEIGSVKRYDKYTATSSLFQYRNSWNAMLRPPYKVHPWVKAACEKHSNTWIPNPNLVQVLNVSGSGALETMESASMSCLERGDIVKMSFKVIVSVKDNNWTMTLSPIQIIRFGQLNDFSGGAINQTEDHTRLGLPRVGEHLDVLQSFSKGKEHTESVKEEDELEDIEWDATPPTEVSTESTDDRTSSPDSGAESFKIELTKALTTRIPDEADPDTGEMEGKQEKGGRKESLRAVKRAVEETNELRKKPYAKARQGK